MKMRLMKFTIYLTTFQFLLFSEASIAQAKPLSMKDALDLMQKNYPLLKEKEADKNAAQYHLRSVKAGFIPDVILADQYQFSTSNGAIGSVFSNEGTVLSTSGGVRSQNIYQGAWGSFSTLMMNWKFFNFGKLNAEKKIAENELAESTIEYENELFRHKVETADDYLLLLAFVQLEKVQQKNLERAESFFNTITAYVKSGIKPGVDSSLAGAELSKAKLLLIRSEQNVSAQKFKLAEMIGSNSKDIEVDTSFFNVNTPNSTILDTSILSKSVLLKFYSSKIDLATSKTEFEKRAAFPSLHLVGALWGRGSGISNTTSSISSDLSEGIAYRTYNYLIALSVAWNISAIPKLHYEYKSSFQKTISERFNYDDVRERIAEQLQEANLEIQTSKQEVAESPIQFNAASDAYAQTKSRYDAGLSTFPELAQALYILNRAEADKIAAFNNSWRALLKQAAASGDITLFTNNIK